MTYPARRSLAAVRALRIALSACGPSAARALTSREITGSEVTSDQSRAVRRLLAWFLPPGEAVKKGVEAEQESALVIGVLGEARRFDDERQVADVELRQGGR
jgi:hypothetical protein